MRILQVTLLWLLTATFAVAASEPEPVLAVLEGSSWFGSSGPSFVLYADGTVIFQSPKEILFREHREDSWLERSRYWKSHISDPVGFLKSMVPDTWDSVKESYRLSAATDQGSTTIWYKGKCTGIYGNWRSFETCSPDDSQEWQNIVAQENALRRTLPTDVRQVLERIDRYTDTAATPWLPDHISLAIGDYRNAREESIIWPADFPEPSRLRSEGSMAFLSGEISLPSNLFPRFVEFMRTRKPTGAILISGHKFNIDSVSFRFPSEAIWSRDIDAVRRAEEQRQLDALSPEARRRLLGQ